MPIEFEPFESLIFIYRHGCSACDAAMPEVDKLMNAHPRLMVTKIEADGPHVASLVGNYRIDATPAYVYRRGNSGVVTVGAMKLKDIEKWLKRIREAGDDE